MFFPFFKNARLQPNKGFFIAEMLYSYVTLSYLHEVRESRNRSVKDYRLVLLKWHILCFSPMAGTDLQGETELLLNKLRDRSHENP